MADLEIRRNGSAWDAVYVAGEFVAQIHREPGARDWDIHFREEIPLETYKTRKEAIGALQERFANQPLRCPTCDAGPGRQDPLYDHGHGLPVGTGRFHCTVCRTEYSPREEKPVIDDEDAAWLSDPARRAAYEKSPEKRTPAEQEMAEDWAGALNRFNEAQHAQPAASDELKASNGKWLTAGELRSFLALFPDDMPVTAWTEGDRWLNVIGASNPYLSDEPSVILMTRDDFDTRQW